MKKIFVILFISALISCSDVTSTEGPEEYNSYNIISSVDKNVASLSIDNNDVDVAWSSPDSAVTFYEGRAVFSDENKTSYKIEAYDINTPGNNKSITVAANYEFDTSVCWSGGWSGTGGDGLIDNLIITDNGLYTVIDLNMTSPDGMDTHTGTWCTENDNTLILKAPTETIICPYTATTINFKGTILTKL